MLKGN